MKYVKNRYAISAEAKEDDVWMIWNLSSFNEILIITCYFFKHLGILIAYLYLCVYLYKSKIEINMLIQVVPVLFSSSSFFNSRYSPFSFTKSNIN